MYQLLIGANKKSYRVSSERILTVQAMLAASDIPVKDRYIFTGNFIDHTEDVLCIMVEQCDFKILFEILQEIRIRLNLVTVSIRNLGRTTVNITEDTFYCRDYAALLHIPTLELKEGVKAFEPASEGMTRHKDFYISSTSSWGYDGMANRFYTWMPMRMNNKFSHYDLFRLSPGGDSRKINYPGWIAKVYPIAPNEWLLWHPNKEYESVYNYVDSFTPDPMHF
jgi:hypothetical protein